MIPSTWLVSAYLRWKRNAHLRQSLSLDLIWFSLNGNIILLTTPRFSLSMLYLEICSKAIVDNEAIRIATYRRCVET